MVRGKAQTLCASRFLKEAHPYERRGRKDHAGNAGIVGCVPVALQEVAGHDASLHACHGCQGEPATGSRVPRRVHGLVTHALQVLVHRDALLPMYHARRLQVEFVDLRRTPGGMHHQVGFDRVFLRSCAGVDEQVVALSFNGGDRPVHVNFDAQLLASPHDSPGGAPGPVRPRVLRCGRTQRRCSRRRRRRCGLAVPPGPGTACWW